MANETTIKENDLEKKERLAQTYIVISGLLLSNNQNQFLMLLFIGFLLYIMLYYTLLTKIKFPIKRYSDYEKVVSLNRLAVGASGILSLIICVIYNSNGNQLLNKLYSLIPQMSGFEIFNIAYQILNAYLSVVKLEINVIVTPFLFILLTIVMTYSLTIIPEELKNDNVAREIITMIAILKKQKSNR